jgi:hypothetical protein
VSVYVPGEAVIVWLEVSVVFCPFGSVTVTLANAPVGKSEIVMDSAVGVATAIDAFPDFVVSCVDVAVMVAVPAAEGVNTPAEVIVPSVAAHVTVEL